MALHRASNGSLDLFSVGDYQVTILSTYETIIISDVTTCDSGIKDVLLAAGYDLQSRSSWLCFCRWWDFISGICTVSAFNGI